MFSVFVVLLLFTFINDINIIKGHELGEACQTVTEFIFNVGEYQLGDKTKEDWNEYIADDFKLYWETTLYNRTQFEDMVLSVLNNGTRKNMRPHYEYLYTHPDWYCSFYRTTLVRTTNECNQFLKVFEVYTLDNIQRIMTVHSFPLHPARYYDKLKLLNDNNCIENGNTYIKTEPNISDDDIILINKTNKLFDDYLRNTELYYLGKNENDMFKDIHRSQFFFYFGRVKRDTKKYFKELMQREFGKYNEFKIEFESLLEYENKNYKFGKMTSQMTIGNCQTNVTNIIILYINDYQLITKQFIIPNKDDHDKRQEWQNCLKEQKKDTKTKDKTKKKDNNIKKDDIKKKQEL